MSTIVINYNHIQDAISSASKVSKRMNTYAEGVNSALNSLNSLPGSDDKGYVSNAISLASKKAQEAAEQAERFSSFSSKLDHYCEYVKKQDQTAANGINMIVEAYIGKRSWLQKVGDFFYDGYINFLNGVENLGPVGKFIAQGIRNIVNDIQETRQKIYNLFKYGNGKYVLNIAKAVLDVFVAVGAAVTIAFAAIATPILAPLCLVGVIALDIYSITKLGDMMATAEGNIKALSLSGGLLEMGHGDITAARYYGDISGLQSWTEKTDFGGAVENAVMEGLGDIYQGVQFLSKVTGEIAGLMVGIMKFGFHADLTGNTTFELDRAFKGYGYDKLHNIGFFSGVDNNGFAFRKALKPKTISKTYAKYHLDMFSAQFLNNTKTVSNIGKLISDIDTFTTCDGFSYGLLDASFDILGQIPFFDAFTGDIWKWVGLGKRAIAL